MGTSEEPKCALHNVLAQAPARPDASERRLLHNERLLILTQVVGVAVVVVLFVLLVVGIPGAFIDLQISCSGPNCPRGQLSPAYVQVLEDFGFPLVCMLFTRSCSKDWASWSFVRCRRWSSGAVRRSSWLSLGRARSPRLESSESLLS